MSPKQRKMAQNQVIERRILEGYSSYDIAEEMSLSVRTIQRRMNDIRAVWLEQATETRETLVAQSLASLMHMEQQAIRKNSVRNAVYARSCIINLLGLSRPVRVEHSGRTEVAAEVDVNHRIHETVIDPEAVARALYELQAGLNEPVVE